MTNRYQGLLAPHAMRPGPTLTRTPVESQGPNLWGYLGRQALNYLQAPRMVGQVGGGILGSLANSTAAHLTGEIPIDGSRDYRGAGEALNAVGTAGMLSPLAGAAGRAFAFAKTKPAAGITAYHGSPHDFDKFKMSQIGTGEGAQAYGHGMYFADNPGVAKSYRDKLSRDALTGRVNPLLKKTAKEMEQHSTGQYGKFKSERGYQLKDRYNRLMDIRAGDETKPAPWGGRMYKVNIKANPDDFLDYDTAFKRQPEKIQSAIKRAAGKSLDDDDYYDLPMRDLMQTIAARTAPKGVTGQRALAGEHLSAQLRDAGIPGIRYLDQGSRGAGKGTYNYVVFDEDLIEITKKMGIALPAPPQFGEGAVAVSEGDLKKIKAATKRGKSRHTGLLKDIY